MHYYTTVSAPTVALLGKPAGEMALKQPRVALLGKPAEEMALKQPRVHLDRLCSKLNTNDLVHGTSLP